MMSPVDWPHRHIIRWKKFGLRVPLVEAGCFFFIIILDTQDQSQDVSHVSPLLHCVSPKLAGLDPGTHRGADGGIDKSGGGAGTLGAYRGVP